MLWILPTIPPFDLISLLSAGCRRGLILSFCQLYLEIFIGKKHVTTAGCHILCFCDRLNFDVCVPWLDCFFAEKLEIFNFKNLTIWWVELSQQTDNRMLDWCGWGDVFALSKTVFWWHVVQKFRHCAWCHKCPWLQRRNLLRCRDPSMICIVVFFQRCFLTVFFRHFGPCFCEGITFNIWLAWTQIMLA